MSSEPRVAVVILNWRRPEETVGCIASVFDLAYGNLDIVVCDNASGDGSEEAIRAFLLRELPEVNRRRAAAGHAPFVLEDGADAAWDEALHDRQRFILIQTGRNGGYAFGNNAGIRAALAVAAVRYVWILNNDTAVDRDSLGALVEHVRRDGAIGLCGSLVLYLDDRRSVQTLGGGRFLIWRARGEQLGSGLSPADLPSVDEVERKLDYVNGAAALVSRELIETVGLMDESYFLYFEEIDWARRARRAGFRLGYAPQALVYHQVGAATGSADDRSPTASSIYHAERSKFRFLRKHHPLTLVLAYPLMLRAVASRLVRGRTAAARAMFSGALGLREP